jgi:hypothetical protein
MKPQEERGREFGAEGGNRTRNLTITNRAQYHFATSAQLVKAN